MSNILEIHDELVQANLDASRVTQEEITVLFQGERRDKMYGTRNVVWSEWARVQYRRDFGE